MGPSRSHGGVTQESRWSHGGVREGVTVESGQKSGWSHAGVTVESRWSQGRSHGGVRAGVTVESG